MTLLRKSIALDEPLVCSLCMSVLLSLYNQAVALSTGNVAAAIAEWW